MKNAHDSDTVEKGLPNDVATGMQIFGGGAHYDLSIGS